LRLHRRYWSSFWPSWVPWRGVLAFLGFFGWWPLKHKCLRGPPTWPASWWRARGGPLLSRSPPRHGRNASLGGGFSQSLKAFRDGNARPPPHMGRFFLPVARGGPAIKGLFKAFPWASENGGRPKASISGTTRKSLAPPHGHRLGGAREGSQKAGQEDQGSAFGESPQIA